MPSTKISLILPFGLPPASVHDDHPMSKQLKQFIGETKAPFLAQLLQAHTALDKHPLFKTYPDYTRSQAHEIILCQTASNFSDFHCNFEDGAQSNSPPLSHFYMKQCGINLPQGHWFTLSPIYMHADIDHFRIPHSQMMHISDAESRQLFDIAQNTCYEYGAELIYGNAQQWFFHVKNNEDSPTHEWRDMLTTSLDTVSNRNLDIWLAEGTHARKWRQLQNEIQMQWHEHPINQHRQKQGLYPINSVWLHSGSDALLDLQFQTLSTQDQLDFEYRHFVLQDLLIAAMNEDWHQWQQALQAYDETVFAPCFQKWKNHDIDEIQLYFTHANHVLNVNCTHLPLWKKWVHAFFNPKITRNHPSHLALLLKHYDHYPHQS